MTAAWTEILIKTCSFEGTRSLVLVQSLNFICSQTLIWKSSASPAGFETATVTIWIKQTCDTERGGGEWWELNLVHRSTSRRQCCGARQWSKLRESVPGDRRPMAALCQAAETRKEMSVEKTLALHCFCRSSRSRLFVAIIEKKKKRSGGENLQKAVWESPFAWSQVLMQTLWLHRRESETLAQSEHTGIIFISSAWERRLKIYGRI